MKLKFSAVMLTLILALSTLLAITECQAQSLEKQSNQDIFMQANDYFHKGVKAAKSDKERSKAYYEDSLVRYKYLVDQRKIVNGKLFYNLGNLHFMRGEMGHAILNYRRALQYIPGDKNLLSNLKVARTRTQTAVRLNSSQRLLSIVMFWHEDISRSLRLRLLQLLLAILGAAGLYFELSPTPKKSKKTLLITLAVLAGLLTLSLVVEQYRHAEPEGVIVAERTIGRKGPGEYAYQPSFDQPLSAGVEFELLEKRNDWSLIRLNDDRETWVPSSSYELVDIE